MVGKYAAAYNKQLFWSCQRKVRTRPKSDECTMVQVTSIPRIQWPSLPHAMRLASYTTVYLSAIGTGSALWRASIAGSTALLVSRVIQTIPRYNSGCCVLFPMTPCTSMTHLYGRPRKLLKSRSGAWPPSKHKHHVRHVSMNLNLKKQQAQHHRHQKSQTPFGHIVVISIACIRATSNFQPLCFGICR